MAITDTKFKTPGLNKAQDKPKNKKDMNIWYIKHLVKKYAPRQSWDGVLSVEITLTPAQILDLWQTPIEIVPAPGPGKIIQPVTSVVEYEQVNWGTTDYSPIVWQPILLYDYDFWYNPNLVNDYIGRALSTSLSIATGQYPYVTPASNVFPMGIAYIKNPINKWVNLWFVIDVNNAFTLPSVGDRNITFRFNYRILDLSFTPILDSTQYPFTLKTACTWWAFTPFDGTETNWTITRLYTYASSDVLPDFVLNPVYEWAGVWNLWDWLVYSSSNLNQQGWWACYISCVKGWQTIYFSTRRTFGSIAGTVLTINGTYIV